MVPNTSLYSTNNNANGETGVDHTGAPASGYTRPQSWGTGWADQINENPEQQKSSKVGKWLHKASSHPSERGSNAGDLRDESGKQGGRKFLRSGGLKVVHE